MTMPESKLPGILWAWGCGGGGRERRGAPMSRVEASGAEAGGEVLAQSADPGRACFLNELRRTLGEWVGVEWLNSPWGQLEALRRFFVCF